MHLSIYRFLYPLPSRFFCLFFGFSVPPRYALDHIPKAQAGSLYARFVAFEKQHGDRAGIEDVVVSKRRCVVSFILSPDSVLIVTR